MYNCSLLNVNMKSFQDLLITDISRFDIEKWKRDNKIAIATWSMKPKPQNTEKSDKDTAEKNNDTDNSIEQQPKKKNFGRNRLPYILSALLLLLLSILLLRTCYGSKISNAEKGRKYLPETHALPVPIKASDIVSGEDSLTFVVSNRLNILLKSEKIYDFAYDFKKQYPDNIYRIIYYDTVVGRLQLEIPKKKKTGIRNELKQILSQYDFTVWDESLFENNYTPNDPAIRDIQKSWHINAIRAPDAWDRTQGSPDIIVAIIDDGFDLNHPKLKEHVYKPYNVFTKNSQVTSSPTRRHGTHVAGLAIGMSDNREGISGIAPNCKFMPIQITSEKSDVISSTAIIDGIIYAIYNGADVINLSSGMSFGPLLSDMPPFIQRKLIANNFKEEERVWNKIFQTAEEHNTTIVIAAGNKNVPAGIDPMQRNNYCIKVSAVTSKTEKAPFSNYGKYSTVSAPGVSIYSSVPGNKYEFMDGTSMAASLVTGGVALIKSIDKVISSRSIIQLLQNTGIPVYSKLPAGNLIQLDKALDACRRGDFPPENFCDDISRKIDSFTQIIEELKRQCPSYETPDTLKWSEVIKDSQILNGKWKSTSPFHNTTGEDITAHFEFMDGSGTLTLAEPGGQICTAPIHVNTDNNKMEIIQDAEAQCSDGRRFSIYLFSCESDNNGNAKCLAIQSDYKANRIIFNLIKIQ